MDNTGFINISYQDHNIEGEFIIVSYSRTKRRNEHLKIPLTNNNSGNWNIDNIRDFLTEIVQEENIVENEKSLLAINLDQKIEQMVNQNENRVVIFVIDLFQTFVNSYNNN
ncbi:hypothetical protein EG856_00065 [Mycoplasmopsis phocirhinis]|uniref:Uncharacterized protein n=1 Tax=Mycoplasmopsis phocirhinis TaxID=142650 RepID=A0A4P6MNM8_9BACT|nr:hypothetical protein [Mycoplasmopsis phocirhinis]QBF34336.1 hypothetical protein EG856_00065 [Mycoplasmopsis phocirhinis]